MQENKFCTNDLTKFSNDLNGVLRLVDAMNLILILSPSLNIQWKEPYLYDFVKKKFSIGLCSEIY